MHVVTSEPAIEKVAAVCVSLPLRRALRWQGVVTEPGRFVIVEVCTDDGLVGVGEVSPFPEAGGDFNRYGGQTIEATVHAIERVIGPALTGICPFDVEAAARAMDRVLGGHLMAKAAVEMALFDLQGKLTGQPLYRLLGGRIRDSVQIAHTIGLMPNQDALDEALAAAADGCTAFHLKAGSDLERDIALLTTFRAELGDDVTLWVDLNQAYAPLHVKAAVLASRRLAEAGADVLEQPGEGLRQMAAIRAAVDVPVVADESLWHPAEALPVIEAGAADALSIYVSKAGGLHNARKLAMLAEAFGVPCNVNGAFVGAISTAVSLHLAVAMPSISLASPIRVPARTDAAVPPRVLGQYFTDDVASGSFRFEGGQLFPPESPGLGVTLDAEKVAAYRIDINA